MNIKNFGGEFALIERIDKILGKQKAVNGIGDDAAVLEFSKEKFLLLTIDALVQDRHFSLKWFSPAQIGAKAIEVNVSDICAMGGSPSYALVSLVLPENISVEFVEKMYQGIREAAKRHKVSVVGGNITKGKELVVDVAMAGFVSKKDLRLRSTAKPDEFIFVSGPLGGATAGLRLFEKGINGFSKAKSPQLNPSAKLSKSKKIVPLATSLTDVSDGLASEARNISKASGCGALIFAENIPLHSEAVKAAKALKMRALDFALFGGEDYELVFTCREKDFSKALKLGVPVGITFKGKGVFLHENGRVRELKKFGYDHFR